MRILTFSSMVFLTVIGCESDFNPKGPFYDRMVVFSVLSPGSTTQFARVFTTYNPPGFNPLESISSNQIENATVTISRNGAPLFMFRETTFARTDLSRYQDSIRAYVASPVNLDRDSTYTLTVNSPTHGSITASMTVPGRGVIEVDPSSLPGLTQPGAFDNDIFVFATPSESGQGHLIKMYLEYEIASNPGIFMREEIPVTITHYIDCVTFDAAYPEIRRRRSGIAREIWTFPHINYRLIILKILKQHESQVVNFRRIIFTMTQSDVNLYSYLSLVNGFRDEFSIRVDRPNYTNVQGGLGLFGSFAADSIAMNVGPTFTGMSCSQ